MTIRNTPYSRGMHVALTMHQGWTTSLVSTRTRATAERPVGERFAATTRHAASSYLRILFRTWRCGRRCGAHTYFADRRSRPMSGKLPRGVEIFGSTRNDEVAVVLPDASQTSIELNFSTASHSHWCISVYATRVIFRL